MKYILKEVREVFGTGIKDINLIKAYVSERFGADPAHLIDSILVFDGELYLLSAIRFPGLPMRLYKCLGTDDYAVTWRFGSKKFPSLDDALRFCGLFHPCMVCGGEIKLLNYGGRDVEEVRREAISIHLRNNPECLYEAVMGGIIIGGAYIRGPEDVSEILGASVEKVGVSVVIRSRNLRAIGNEKVIWKRSSNR